MLQYIKLPEHCHKALCLWPCGLFGKNMATSPPVPMACSLLGYLWFSWALYASTLKCAQKEIGWAIAFCYSKLFLFSGTGFP